MKTTYINIYVHYSENIAYWIEDWSKDTLNGTQEIVIEMYGVRWMNVAWNKEEWKLIGDIFIIACRCFITDKSKHLSQILEGTRVKGYSCDLI